MVAQAPDGRFGAPQLANESDINNVLYTAKSQRGERKGNRFQGKVFGVLEPVKGLAITGSYFTDMFQTLDWSGTQPSDLWNFATDLVVRSNSGNPLTLTNSYSKSERYVVDVFADYNKSIGVHNFHLLAGYNQEYFRSTGFSGTRQDLLSYETPVLDAAT